MKNKIIVAIAAVGCVVSLMGIGNAGSFAPTADLSLNPTTVQGIPGVFGDPVTLSGTVSDGDELWVGLVYVDGVKIAEINLRNPYDPSVVTVTTDLKTATISHGIDTINLAIGSHEVSVKIADWSMGNADTQGVLFNVGSFTVESPLTLSPTTVVSEGVCSDAEPVTLSGIVKDPQTLWVVLVYVDDVTVATIDARSLSAQQGDLTLTTATISYQINTTNLAIGAHQVDVRVADWSMGNADTQGVLFNVGSFTVESPPETATITIDAPEDVQVWVTDKNNTPEDFSDDITYNFVSDGTPQEFDLTVTNLSWHVIEGNAASITGVWKNDNAWIGVCKGVSLRGDSAPQWSLDGNTLTYTILEEPKFTFELLSNEEHIMWPFPVSGVFVGDTYTGINAVQFSRPNGTYLLQGNAANFTGVYLWDSAWVNVNDGLIMLLGFSSPNFIQLTDTVVAYGGGLKNHGQFISTVAHGVDDLIIDGAIDKAEGEEIVSAAARSTFAMPPRSKKPGNAN